jgi:hypothetical protein
VTLRPVVWILVGMVGEAALTVLVAKLMAGKAPGLNRFRPPAPPSKGDPCACR